MTASPKVFIQDGGGPFIDPSNPGVPNFPAGVNVTPGNTISIFLQDSSSVSFWSLQIIGVDELTTVPTLTNVNPVTHLVATPGSIVTFVVPSGVAGRTYIFSSMVNNGGVPFTSTFGIYTLTVDGFRVAAVGERFEGDAVFGWARTVNKFIRNGVGSGGGPETDPLSIHKDGSSTVSADIPMNSHKITGLTSGTNAKDAATFDQIPSIPPETDPLSIHKDGSSTVSADIPMNSHKITGLTSGTNAKDAATFDQIPSIPPETDPLSIHKDGSSTVSADIPMNSA